MLRAQHTPNIAGVLLTGDFDDFYSLYDALHSILGHTEELEVPEGAAVRVLGFCYDVRHAFMGNRGAGFKNHGLEEEQMRFLSLVGPKQNLFLSFETLWPEMLFVVFSLEEYIRYYVQRTKATMWDPNVALVRNLQATIYKLVEETVTKNQFASFKKWIDPFFISPIVFPQYIDYLNGEWVKLTRDEREKKLTIFAKRTCQVTADYERQQKKLLEAAIEYECDPRELRFPTDFYDDIEW